jgi:hypothetical protein
MRSVLVATLLGVALAIYPDDHWSRSTKLTAANADEVIKREVDAGRTLFVRWIASEG